MAWWVISWKSCPPQPKKAREVVGFVLRKSNFCRKSSGRARPLVGLWLLWVAKALSIVKPNTPLISPRILELFVCHLL